MERRQFMRVSAIGAVGTATGSSLASEASAKSSSDTLANGNPVVMAPRTDGVEILWRVSGLAKGSVEYGTTKELGEVARNDGWGLRPAGKDVIRVRLDGLDEGTTYYYRIVTESFDRKKPVLERGAIRSFRTLSANAPASTFSIWNDTHQQNPTIRKLASITPPSDFLMWNGDTCNDWYREGEVAETLLNPGDGVDFTAKHPLFLLRGNHDLRGTFAHEVEDFAATPDGKPWYAFRSGPVAVICLDTGEDKPDDHPHLFGRVACEPMRREQAAWLGETIARPEIRDAPYRIVFCHIPLRWVDEKTEHGYDYFSKRSRDLWHELLVKWGTQVVISGHTHQDEYLKPDAKFPYAQLVGGGPRMNQARLISGVADERQLTLRMIDMEGVETRNLSFKPLV